MARGHISLFWQNLLPCRIWIFLMNSIRANGRFIRNIKNNNTKKIGAHYNTDRCFHNFDPSKSVNRRLWTILSWLRDGFQGSKIVNGSVGIFWATISFRKRVVAYRFCTKKKNKKKRMRDLFHPGSLTTRPTHSNFRASRAVRRRS